MPFVIKSYKYRISDEDKARLFAELESLVIRHRIIGTRAHLEDRIKKVYEKFTEENKDVCQIIDRIRWLKKKQIIMICGGIIIGLMQNLRRHCKEP